MLSRKLWCAVACMVQASRLLTCSAQQEQCSTFAPPAILSGRKFFQQTKGEYLPIKGINYYPRPNSGELVRTNSIDFFTEEYRSVWERDVARFKELGINVVRLYAVNPGLSHDSFMCALQEAGIYVIVGLAADCENCAITKVAAPECYPVELKARGQFIISEFARYDNVLAFSAGNEVSLNSGSPLVNGPCQKKFIRDMRAFIRSCSNTIRPIPVGLAIADVGREAKILWYNCRSDPDDDLENAEYIGMNSYLHCDSDAPADNLVGYETLLSDFADFKVSVPVVITEFGCIDNSFPTIDGYEAQRNFLQVDALYTTKYRQEFVGGVVFEYNTELQNSLSQYPFFKYGEGNFGVGYLTPEDCDEITIPCTYVPFPQFDTLAAKYKAVDTSDEPPLSQYDAGVLTTPTCPAQFSRLDSVNWPSDAIDDSVCPGRVFVNCPGIPSECSNLGIQSLPVDDTPTASPTVDTQTQSPTASIQPTTMPSDIPTSSPTTTNAPTQVASGTPSNAPSMFEMPSTTPTYEPTRFIVAVEPTDSPAFAIGPLNADTSNSSSVFARFWLPLLALLSMAFLR